MEVLKAIQLHPGNSAGEFNASRKGQRNITYYTTLTIVPNLLRVTYHLPRAKSTEMRIILQI